MISIWFTGDIGLFQAIGIGVTKHIFDKLMALLSQEDMIWNRRYYNDKTL